MKRALIFFIRAMQLPELKIIFNIALVKVT